MIKKVLVIEDNTIIALDIERRVKMSGYDVAGKAESGASALDIAEKTRPDLALVDIRIKGPMDGIDVAKQLRDRFGIPFVFITAYSDRGVQDRAMAIRPDGYLLKPIKQSDLVETLKRILGE